MKCDNCEKDFDEHLIEDSHDVPCYLFEGMNRKEMKNQADKFPRHWLCKECHLSYEGRLRNHLQSHAILFSNKFFGGG